MYKANELIKNQITLWKVEIYFETNIMSKWDTVVFKLEETLIFLSMFIRTFFHISANTSYPRCHEPFFLFTLCISDRLGIWTMDQEFFYLRPFETTIRATK